MLRDENIRLNGKKDISIAGGILSGAPSMGAL